MIQEMISLAGRLIATGRLLKLHASRHDPTFIAFYVVYAWPDPAIYPNL